nr:GntR family transcriptional regulator [Gemmatimonadota bacterium]NIR78496.1 GntR family transcriptional regulator [Gemmatimonadota bacterium]NIT87111.1 GntR family transcriptional regulator [Gemmatimonadota bacterium]NIU30953.1 GntR family transcriptional regulator [Gemmatimonadota bacterium]NIU35708.1 GntR family transcriptional regulator [Gemmatimonadota bacterium]
EGQPDRQLASKSGETGEATRGAGPHETARTGEEEGFSLPPRPAPPGVRETPVADLGEPAPGPERAPEVEGETSAPPDFLELDPTDTVPLYRQIARGIREAAATGRLEPGQRLLPVRALAEAMDLAPGTVARAYRELEREGVLETRGTRGTFLAARERHAPPVHERRAHLVERLRPVAVSAFHLGARQEELRAALEEAMAGILTENRE